MSSHDSETGLQADHLSRAGQMVGASSRDSPIPVMKSLSLISGELRKPSQQDNHPKTQLRKMDQNKLQIKVLDF